MYVQKLGSKFPQSQLRKYDFTWSKDLILSFFPYTQILHLRTAETTTVMHLFPQCVDLFLCMCLWYISVVLPFVFVPLPSMLCRDFLMSPFSPNLPIITKKALCVFFTFCCYLAPLEIRGTFLNAWVSTSYPLMNTTDYERGLRESSLGTYKLPGTVL